MSKTYLPLVDVETILAILNKISIFGGLNDAQLYTLFRTLNKVTYEKDELIFEEGDDPQHLYIVKSGCVRLVKMVDAIPFQLYEFDVGNCFGETSLIGIQPHTASAVALQKTELVVLSARQLFSFYDTDKELFGIIMLNIAREACRRLNQAQNTLLHYYYHK